MTLTPVITPTLPIDVAPHGRKCALALYDSNLDNLSVSDITDSTYGWVAGQAGKGLHKRIRWFREARGRRVELLLDRPGSVSFNLPVDSVEAWDVLGFEIERAVMLYMQDRTGTLKERWSGPIWTARANSESGRVEVTAVGWDQLFDTRELRNEVRFIKRRSSDIAQSIVDTANRQIANDATQANKPAEDLLFGTGDFEDSGTFSLLPPNESNWQTPPPHLNPDFGVVSGAHALELHAKGTPGDPFPGGGYVQINSRSGDEAHGEHSDGFLVEPGVEYVIACWLTRMKILGNVAIGDYNHLHIEVEVYNPDTDTFDFTYYNLYDQIDTWPSAESTIYFELSGIFHPEASGGAYSAGYATVWLYISSVRTAEQRVVLDGVTISRNVPTAPGHRSFPINKVVTASYRGNTVPYITNLVRQASFEQGLGANVGLNAQSIVQRTQEWAGTGDFSLRVSGVSTAAQEIGTSAPLTNKQILAGSPVYIQAKIRVIVPGPNGIVMRYKQQNSANVVLNTFTIPAVGVGTHVLEMEVASTPTTAERGLIEFFGAATGTGQTIQFLVDDVMVVNDASPLPFISGDTATGYLKPTEGTFAYTESWGPIYTRTYAATTKLGQILREMTEVEWGIDYDIHPVSRDLRLWWDRVKDGSTMRGKGRDRPDVIWGYRTLPHNVAMVGDDRDGARMANRVNTLGKVGRGLAQDMESIDKYGIFEETVPLSDVVDPPLPMSSILAAYAGAEVAFRKTPPRTVTFTPNKWRAGGSVPMFAEDYDLGDITYLYASYGVINIGDPLTRSPQAMRVFGARFNISDNTDEEENLSLDTIYST